VKFLTTIFCDDVRREEGNKLSYMGVYTGNLLVPSFPQVLPRLCFAMTMTVPAATELNELKFRLYKDDEVLAEQEVPANVIASIAAAPVDQTEEQLLRIGTVFQLFPLQLSERCRFRSRAICNGEEFKGGSLSVEAFPPNWPMIYSPGLMLPMSPVLSGQN
jgi:hypothetical protein